MSTFEIITDRDLADRLGKSVAFVQSQCRLKTWPHLRVGKSLRFTPAHVEFIEALLEVPAATEPAPVTPQPSEKNPWDRKGRKS